jgi:RNA recognition motif-containing protein
VGNLNFRTTPADLSNHLSQAGEIVDVYLATDRETGRSRGFAFVTFADEATAARAIKMFDGVGLDGRQLNINEAREREREHEHDRDKNRDRDRDPRPPRKPRPFIPQEPSFLADALPGESYDDNFRAYDRGEFEKDEDAVEGDAGGTDRKARGERRRPKTKGSRRRLRARKRDF